jgi:hypothetical protein
MMNKKSNFATALAAALCAAAFGATFGVADEQATTPRLELVDAQRVAPNFIGIDNWLNSVPLNIADLRGKSSWSISGPTAATIASTRYRMSLGSTTRTGTRA